MKIRCALIAVITTLLPATTTAMEVKGLKIGSIVSEDRLAAIFGSAECPSNDQVRSSDSFRKPLHCTVPISYLGIKTSAKVYLTQKWVVQGLSIYIPGRLEEIEAILEKKYGKPHVMRTTVRVIEVGNKTITATDMCTRWFSVNGVNVSVCEARQEFESSVNYTLATLSPLEPSDI